MNDADGGLSLLRLDLLAGMCTCEPTVERNEEVFFEPSLSSLIHSLFLAFLPALAYSSLEQIAPEENIFERISAIEVEEWKEKNCFWKIFDIVKVRSLCDLILPLQNFLGSLPQNFQNVMENDCLIIR